MQFPVSVKQTRVVEVFGSPMIRHRSTALLAACVTCLGLVLGASAKSIANSVVVQESGFTNRHVNNRKTLQPGTNRHLPQTANPNLAIALPSNLNKNQLKWLLVFVATLAVVGAGVILLLKWLNTAKKAAPKPLIHEDTVPKLNSSNSVVPQSDELIPEPASNGHNQSALTVSVPHPAEATSPVQTAADTLSVKKNTSLSKIDIVDELIGDLRSPDPQKRRQAIWELAQRGDSRAIQPLVDLIIDSDSQQRSLILEALSQIGTKTLKPMNRALAVSLQDDNAEVRKNAIRDLTRIYEVVAQTTQMLCHAADDPNPEVRETARWAISQLSRIRTPDTLNKLPPSHSLNSSENGDREQPS